MINLLFKESVSKGKQYAYSEEKLGDSKKQVIRQLEDKESN